MSKRSYAPWSRQQVRNLNAWQESEWIHPFTHPCGSVLRATPFGWVCPEIGCPTDEEMDEKGWPFVVQTWAHAFMTRPCTQPPAPPIAGTTD